MTAVALEAIVGEDESVKLNAPTPIYGALNVTSSPVEATVYLDGTEIGKTPFVNNKVIVGKHKLKFVKDGCETSTKDIEVVEGQMITVNEKLVVNGVVRQETEVKPEVKNEKDVFLIPHVAALSLGLRSTTKVVKRCCARLPVCCAECGIFHKAMRNKNIRAIRGDSW